MGLASAFVAPPASAEDMTWTIKSDYEYKVSLSFYSQNRDHSWPGPGSMYPLDDSRHHQFTLACRDGEQICYGAWPTGGGTIHWGVGRNNQYHCRSCCYVCGRSNPSVTLTDD
jgi:hypothetical protein